MTLVDVHQAVDSADCDWPRCDREAERGGRCRYHAGRAIIEPEEPPVITCKIDGCYSAPVDSRGPYSGLCQHHKREKAAAMGAARRKPSAPTETPAVPPPVAQPARQNGHAPLTLTQLAQAVDEAQDNLDRAQQQRDQALARLREAVQAA